MKLLLPIALIVIFVLVSRLIYVFIRNHMLGTFKFDNSGDTYRCRFEFDNLDDVEKLKFAIVRIEEDNLNLPGEKYPQD